METNHGETALMPSSSTFELGHQEDGSPRRVQIIQRDDGSIFIYIRDTRQSCYIEESELRAILRELEFLKTRTKSTR